ncbi:MAG: carboxypeptidase-like regulatory domain-containing protein, partial [Muribaculaceae bacterium]|nr:carboxypeptidase-like regulatory domain-containing protein [Muribaculaceae bacterium]
YYDYSTSLRITGDMSFNIELEPLAPLPGDGAQVGEYTISDYSYKSPFNPLEYMCVTETIYPKDMLGNLTEGEKYSSITFYGYNPSSTPAPNPDEGDDDDDPYGGYYAPALKAETPSNTFNITVYMVDTDDSKFTATSEGEGDYSAYTKLYEGPVTISEGGSAKNPVALFTADFVKPYVYGGKNIKLIVLSNCKSYKIINFCTDPAAKSNVIQKYGNNADMLETADWRQATDGVPVFKLGDYVPVAEVNGTVTDKSSDEAIEGVEVTVSYDTDKYTATTDAEGKYVLYVRNVEFNEDYILTVEYGDYNEESEIVSFTEETMEQTFNFALVQEGEISGVITDSETNDPVEGATVTLLKGEEVVETTTSDASGAYIFTMEEAVYGEFTVKVEAADYPVAMTQTVTLSAEKAKVTDLNFVLDENASGVAEIFGGELAGDVVNVSGVVVRRNATADDIKSLPQGIYIIGNKKVVVK